ncbi:MAG: A/G-specific adenine glycosylase [Bacteroidetes bacterium]|nr:MAG: A/G-specific adenine glycosylase [Bacteroidota bacterium]
MAVCSEKAVLHVPSYTQEQTGQTGYLAVLFFISMHIGDRIVKWYEQQGRDMPWREVHDPYLIWIQEVVMQQTRIEQGVGYYERFVARFPDLKTLAEAPLDEVLKYWEGLGYYSRARNLHAAAQQLVSEHGGIFPRDPQALMRLKGIGPYTARAIASFAFGAETGVIDGNVLRVMARVLGDDSPINQPRTRKAFQGIIDTWVQGVPSRAFNHGIIDLGATVCTPTQPGCLLCPLETACVARAEGHTHLLPFKEKKGPKPVRYFHFYMVHDARGARLIRQRPAQGLWGGLWEIPNAEVEAEAFQRQLDPRGGDYCFSLRHIFTHFEMQIGVYTLPTPAAAGWEGQFVSPEKISTFAFARAVLNIFSRWEKNAPQTGLL